jgi:hypothetical protein
MKKYSRKLTSKHHIKKQTQFIKRKTNKNISKNNDFNKQFELANNIFKTITIKKESFKNIKEFYWIISKKHNSYLDNQKYTIIHFLLYCLLRFHDSPHKQIINNFVNFPINFPTNRSYRSTSKHIIYNSFNYLLYLNNFIYHLLENNLKLNDFITKNENLKSGYNLNIDNSGKVPMYNIYFANLNKIIINNRYPINAVNNYVQTIHKFISNNYSLLVDNNLLSNIIQFYNTHVLDFNNKFIIVDDLYIPKCHIEYHESFTNDIIENLLQYEIPYNRIAQKQKIATVFGKLRSINKLKIDLEKANISIKDYNDMIRSIKPLPFKNKMQYREFIKDITTIISTKLKNYTIKIIGSSTTFYSANPKNEKTDKVFDETSDIDVNIIPNENFDIHKPILENIDGKDDNDFTYSIYITKFNIYVSSILINFFGIDIMRKFFEKWGPKQYKNDIDAKTDIFSDIKKDKTILKYNISITMSTKVDMYDNFDVIKNNKTCLPNFASFISNGKNISYWDENNKLITEHI